MKKTLLGLMLAICTCTSAFAFTGKQEFIIIYPDEELRFINDGNYMLVLQTKKNVDDRDSRAEPQSCMVVPLVNNEAMAGKNKIVFYNDFAVVNDKKRHFYVGKKTELLFFRQMCKKPK